MKKQDFTKLISSQLNITQAEATNVISTIETIILATVKSGDSVAFAGAEFSTKTVKGRSGIMNGIEWTTEDKMVGCVKAKSLLKDLK